MQYFKGLALVCRISPATAGFFRRTRTYDGTGFNFLAQSLIGQGWNAHKSELCSSINIKTSEVKVYDELKEKHAGLMQRLNELRGYL